MKKNKQTSSMPMTIEALGAAALGLSIRSVRSRILKCTNKQEKKWLMEDLKRLTKIWDNM